MVLMHFRVTAKTILQIFASVLLKFHDRIGSPTMIQFHFIQVMGFTAVFL